MNNASWFGHDVRESLLARPLKTGLTFTAIAIGMLALAMLLGILAGLQTRAEAQVAELGADVIALAPPAGQANLLDRAALERLRHLVPNARIAASRTFRLHDAMPGESIEVVAAEAAYPSIRGWSLQSGRWLDARDEEEGSAFAVISSGLAERHRLVAGNIIRMRDTSLRIIGIIAHMPESRIITVPTLSSWWLTEPATSLHFDQVHIKVAPGVNPDELASRLQRDYESDRRAPGSTWQIVTPSTLIAGTQAMMQTVRMVYGSVAILCLALGGVTLFSLMMVSIQQRISEIGLRMAFGASWRDIFILFLAEGMIITLAAGVAGTCAGMGLLVLFGESMALPVAWTPVSIITPVITALILGLLSTLYPAHTAAAITPAEALRAE
jgi:putative ABC transport system permease protein